MAYGVQLPMYALAVSVAALAALLACYYRSSLAKFALGMAALIAAFAFFAYFGFFYLFLEAVAAGSVIGWITASFSEKKLKRRASPQVERSRDIVHAALGVAVIALFYFAGPIMARYVLLSGILALYALNAVLNHYRGGAAAKLLLRLEKPDVVYGKGAALLAFGVLLAASFIYQNSYLEFAFVALFFGDAAATFAGTLFGRIKLPYSKSKSIAGTAAFFLVVGAIGMPLIGWYALPAALVLALLESVETRIDDNVLVSVGAIALYAVFVIA